jgi:hypothetical protein
MFVRCISRCALAAALLVLPCPAFPQPLAPELMLQPGETRSIPARRWVFSRVSIPIGAVLEVEQGSGEVMQFIVLGDFDLQGSIVARGWSSEEVTHRLTMPDGRFLDVSFQNRNRGGNGGDGALAAGALGGRGARGSVDYGGGGGGGGAWASDRQGKPGNVNGASAQDERGAPRVIAWCGVGGANGATRDPFANGGVIYLEVNGRFNGAGGQIDLRGKDGVAGASGPRASRYDTNCAAGSGGAGGGAPGGQGGVVVGYIAGPAAAYPTLRMQGGAGGPPGTTAPEATTALEGQPGRAGWVQWNPGR